MPHVGNLAENVRQPYDFCAATTGHRNVLFFRVFTRARRFRRCRPAEHCAVASSAAAAAALDDPVPPAGDFLAAAFAGRRGQLLPRRKHMRQRPPPPQQLIAAAAFVFSAIVLSSGKTGDIRVGKSLKHVKRRKSVMRVIVVIVFIGFGGVYTSCTYYLPTATTVNEPTDDNDRSKRFYYLLLPFLLFNEMETFFDTPLLSRLVKIPRIFIFKPC